MTKDRGSLIESDLAPLVGVTVHPSAILRVRDAEERVRNNEEAKQQAAAALKMFGAGNVTDEQKKDNPFFAMLAGGSEKFAAAEAELKQQQLELMRQLSEEQARWTTLNAQLDQLERLFASPRK